MTLSIIPYYAECRTLCIIMLVVITLSVIMLSVVMLNVVVPFLWPPKSSYLKIDLDPNTNANHSNSDQTMVVDFYSYYGTIVYRYICNWT